MTARALAKHNTMQRVVVTGVGIASSIGSTIADVVDALRSGRSGVQFMPDMAERGMRCAVYAPVNGWEARRIPNQAKQTMSTAAMYAATASLAALHDAELQVAQLNRARTSAIVGSDFAGQSELTRMHSLMVGKKKSRAGSLGSVKYPHSLIAGNLATWLGLRGRACCVTCGAASGLANIGYAYELIRHGSIDAALCGGAEEDVWEQIGPYLDNLGLLPRCANDCPARAARPYHPDRCGFVMSAGAGILMLEALDHARKRGARAYAEIIAYTSANDGADLFRPTGEGLRLAIAGALAQAREHGAERVDYINGDGSGTQLGDAVESAAVAETVGDGALFSSTKGLTGHALGASGALEAVYTLLMMTHDFVTPTANLDRVAPECEGPWHVRSILERPLTTGMTFNIGLGGAQTIMIFRALNRRAELDSDDDEGERHGRV